VLLKATKTLNREKLESRNFMEKLARTAKINEMRELKQYARVLQNEKERLTQLTAESEKENERLRAAQSFTNEEIDRFTLAQNQIKDILEGGLLRTLEQKSIYKK
jgi:Leucine-rich repeat (LRR) protein